MAKNVRAVLVTQTYANSPQMPASPIWQPITSFLVWSKPSASVIANLTLTLHKFGRSLLHLTPMKDKAPLHLRILPIERKATRGLYPILES
jgi:hypothetical protein